MPLNLLKKLQRWTVAIIGLTLLAVGIAMILLPGPALLVIPLAVGILATEFAWARHLKRRVHEYLVRCQNGKNN